MLKIFQVIKYIFVTGISVCVITAIIIIYDGFQDNIQQSDAIVILGNKIELTGNPSPRVVSRLNKGFQLYNNKVAPLVIVTGWDRC